MDRSPAPAGLGVLTPRSVEEARELLVASPRVLARGSGTKWGMTDPPPDAWLMDMRDLSGIVEYQPAEFTVTARAGTTLRELQELLDEHGQYLPFDPPFVDGGATLGGAVASGLSGPGRLRFGGVRDFVLGIRFLDGQGRLVRGGGKVVKNAAGFDLPKLFCGSRGRLGVLVEVTLKVFPAPRAFATLVVPFDSLDEATSALRRLARSPLEPHALELVPPEVLAGDPGSSGPSVTSRAPTTLVVRGGGPPAALDGWLARVEAHLGRRGQRLDGEVERVLWERLRDLRWVPPTWRLIRLHLVPSRLPGADAILQRLGAIRHYSVAGNVGWAAVSPQVGWDEVVHSLQALGVPAMAVRGAPPGGVWVVTPPGESFARRVKQALDPDGRFGAL